MKTNQDIDFILFFFVNNFIVSLSSFNYTIIIYIYIYIRVYTMFTMVISIFFFFLRLPFFVFIFIISCFALNIYHRHIYSPTPLVSSILYSNPYQPPVSTYPSTNQLSKRIQYESFR